MIVGQRQAGLWEAGANPALPRNCKRGHRNRSLGLPEKDNLGRPAVVAGCRAKAHTSESSHPDSRSQETGVNHT
jgi:hypothetical protein